MCDFFHFYGDPHLARSPDQGQSVSRSLAEKEMPFFQLSLFQISQVLTRKYEYQLYFCYSNNSHIDFHVYIIVMLTVATYKIIVSI